MKTYSRRKPGSHKKSDHDHDAIFSDVFKESVETEVSPSDTTGNKDADSMGSRKRKNTNAKSKSSELKKLKQTKSEKVSKKKKLQKSKQTTMESTGVSISFTNDDPLFGDGPVMLEEGKKPRAQRQKKASSLASKVSQKKDLEVSEACVPLHNKIPPEVQVGSKDKVSQWLAGSKDAEPVPHDLLEPETSKEMFREIHETADEKQHHMFPEQILKNLHVKPTLIGDTQALNAKRDNFMAVFGNLRKKSMEPTMYQHITPKTWTTKTSETQSPSQDNTITEMDTTYTIDTETSTSVTGLMSTRTHVTETQSDIQTAHTDTQTSETVSRLKEKDTAQVSNTQKKYLCSTMRRSYSTNNTDTFPSELSTVTESLIHKKQDEKTPKRYTNDFKVPGSPTKSATNKTQKKGDLQPKNSTQLFTSGFVEIVNVIPQMSTILMDENSRNSTALQKVVSSEVEDDDKVMMKTVTTKPSMKTSTPNKAIIQEPLFQFDTDISSVTTGSENEDNDVLVFNQSSREVCSADIIHLSTTRIEEIADNNDKIEVIKHYDEEKDSQNHSTLQSAKQNCVNSTQCITKERTLSTKKPDLYTVEQSAINARHPMSLKVAREKNLSFKKNKEAGKKMMHNKFHDMFGNPKRTLSFSSIHSTPSPRRGQLMFNSDKKHPSVNKGNKLDKETADNSVFESEHHSDSKGRSVPVCPLMNDFSCPRKNLSLLVFKTDDTRSYDEIVKTVPVDDLMLEIPTKGYGMKS